LGGVNWWSICNKKKGREMGKSLTTYDLEQIRKRCDTATPAPWISSWEGRDHTAGDSVILRGDQRQFDDLYIMPCTLPDQDFIANARQDVPALLDEIVRLRSIIEKAGLKP
jgi:hypothetical protein